MRHATKKMTEKHALIKKAGAPHLSVLTAAFTDSMLRIFFVMTPIAQPLTLTSVAAKKASVTLSLVH